MSDLEAEAPVPATDDRHPPTSSCEDARRLDTSPAASLQLIGSGHFAGLPRHHFGALYIDPPWSFVTWSTTRQNRAAERHYRVMTLAQIKALPIRDLTKDDAWVFCWTTGPMLASSFDVLSSWRLTYSGLAFTWVKLRRAYAPSLFGITDRDSFMGCGLTTRANAEFCLLAKVGHPKVRSHSVRELVVAPVRAHSQKPNEVGDRIREFCCGPYCELFARRQRDGWTTWGDQIGNEAHD